MKLRLSIRTSRDSGNATEVPLVITLAKDIGPVVVEALGVTATLVSGTVFGTPITPPS